ncbi:hypothetical protein Anapl_07514 [Anas platyrhynchos]|uniref:Uncharacterized protein n=1 Tax=Anas platyrhynchos TaxID=8839 RepID=R0L4S8_ANAPL|nr:hypothetical protein Anapl_07514 [Anas platyrhynchos]
MRSPPRAPFHAFNNLAAVISAAEPGLRGEKTELAKITGELVKAMTPLNKKQKREMLVTDHFAIQITVCMQIYTLLGRLGLWNKASEEQIYLFLPTVLWKQELQHMDGVDENSFYLHLKLTRTSTVVGSAMLNLSQYTLLNREPITHLTVTDCKCICHKPVYMTLRALSTASNYHSKHTIHCKGFYNPCTIWSCNLLQELMPHLDIYLQHKSAAPSVVKNEKWTLHWDYRHRGGEKNTEIDLNNFKYLWTISVHIPSQPCKNTSQPVTRLRKPTNQTEITRGGSDIDYYMKYQTLTKPVHPVQPMQQHYRSDVLPALPVPAPACSPEAPRALQGSTVLFRSSAGRSQDATE